MSSPGGGGGGERLALVNGESNQPVEGMMMCEIMSEAHMDRLVTYYGDNRYYSLESCFIDVLNDDSSVERTVSGVSFMGWPPGEEDIWRKVTSGITSARVLILDI
ncbi:hypothetical protein DPV78_012665 [Talaromyces pinophilus]|nr:hypothetical protein DPV78_012665 [Talaromyces pinophilus]